jgi:tripartite-type tricarboxylate transporter receptor subunit TctC
MERVVDYSLRNALPPTPHLGRFIGTVHWDAASGTPFGFLALRHAIAALALVSSAAIAQTYPARPVRVIVPVGHGGGSDVPARIFAQAISDELGWRLVIDNRPGATGRIGTELAARSPADGYTLLLGGVTPNAVVQSSAPNLPYDTLRDFLPITLIAQSDFILTVHPSLPVKSVKDLVALARAKPGQINFGSVGNISGAHVTGELLKQLAKIDIVHVPYNGPAPAMVALLSGEVSIYFGSGASVTAHARAGRVRLLATAGLKRSKLFPDLPTVNETVAGHESSLWYGILAPAGTPKSVVAAVNEIFAKASRLPKVTEPLAAVSMEPVTNSPEEFTAFIRAEIAKWGKVVKASGAPID